MRQCPSTLSEYCPRMASVCNFSIASDCQPYSRFVDLPIHPTTACMTVCPSSPARRDAGYTCALGPVSPSLAGAVLDFLFAFAPSRLVVLSPA
jgi:hypothetical protein